MMNLLIPENCCSFIVVGGGSKSNTSLLTFDGVRKSKAQLVFFVECDGEAEFILNEIEGDLMFMKRDLCHLTIRTQSFAFVVAALVAKPE